MPRVAFQTPLSGRGGAVGRPASPCPSSRVSVAAVSDAGELPRPTNEVAGMARESGLIAFKWDRLLSHRGHWAEGTEHPPGYTSASPPAPAPRSLAAPGFLCSEHWVRVVLPEPAQAAASLGGLLWGCGWTSLLSG